MTKDDWPALFPAGIHPNTIDSLGSACLGNGLATDRRIELFGRLTLFLEQLAATGVSGEAWIDGSFTTTKPDPSDIDVAIFLDHAAINKLDEEQSACADSLLDRATAAERFGLDLYIDLHGDFHRAAYWRGVFGFCHDQTTPKGIAVLEFNR